MYIVHNTTTDQEIFQLIKEKDDVVLIGIGEDADLTEHLAIKFGLGCVLYRPILPPSYVVSRSSAPRIVVTNNETLRAKYKYFAQIEDEPNEIDNTLWDYLSTKAEEVRNTIAF